MRYQLLMTQHNLQSHISWLLQHTVAPPAGLQIADSTNSRPTQRPIHLSKDEIEQETPRPRINQSRNHRIEQSINVEDVVRPAVHTNPPIPQPVRDLRNEAMTKLQSAQKNTRPGLVSQHQLATPASSKPQLSLSASYSKSLHEQGKCKNTEDFM